MKSPEPALIHVSRARRWLRHAISFSELHGILVWAGFIGFVGALATTAFREAMHAVTYLLTGHTGSFVELSLSLQPPVRFLVPLLGSLFAGLILQLGMRWAKGRQTTDYMEAVTVGDGFISVRASLVKSASSLLTISSGGSIGREGAMVQLAAMGGSILGRIMAFPPQTRRLLVACGAAAGIASAYNAPLAAAVFVCEILLGSLELESIGPIIVSSVIANATVHQFLGYSSVYQIPSIPAVLSWELIGYLVLGLAAGTLGPFFVWLLDHSHRVFQSIRLPLWFRFSLGGMAVGFLSLLEPRVWGNGFSVVNSILHEPWTVPALLSVLVCKVLATAAMVGSGAVGGVFTPTLFCGAVLGALAGTTVHGWFPELTGPPTAYSVVGMGAFLAATTHAPLTSILMVFELTGEYELVLPLMLCSIVADFVSKRYRSGKSIYAEALQTKRAWRDAGQPFSCRELASGSEPFLTLTATLDERRSRFSETSYKSLSVVDPTGRWLGTLSREAALASVDPLSAEGPWEAGVVALTDSMGLEEALSRAAETTGETLPLIEASSGKYLGTVTKSALLHATREFLKKR